MTHDFQSDSQNIKRYFKTGGGGLDANDPSYVERPADQDIIQNLQNEAIRLCWVLDARQMGKTSLINQARKNLEAFGIVAVSLVVDFSSNDPDGWYWGIAHGLLRKFRDINLLNTNLNLNDWWQSQSGSLSKKLQYFFQEILLKEIPDKRIVIFFDEISSVLRFEFDTADFFSIIRNCIDDQEYSRLSFVLIGVANREQLPGTPLNIGANIELTPFTIEAIGTALGQGLEGKADNIHTVLEQVLYWTGGQPFLTQKLCYLLSKNVSFIHDGKEKDIVENIVQTKIISNWRSQDDLLHLLSIESAIGAENDTDTKEKRLILYQKLLEEEEINFNRSQKLSPEMELIISGIVVKENDKLRIYNRIYAQIFAHQWLEEQWEQIYPFKDNIKLWVESGYQDESQFVSSDQLQKLKDLSEKRRLNDEESNFLEENENFNQKIWKYFYNKTLKYGLIVDAIMLWTKGNKSLNDLIFEFAAKCDFQGDEYNEKEWVDKVVMRSPDLGGILSKEDFIQLITNRFEHLGELRMLSEENAKRNKENFRKIGKRFNNPMGIVDEILSLTQREPELTEIIVNLIVRDGSRINTEDDCAKVEEVVKTELIKDWETNSDATHFQKIKSQLMENIELLESYQEVVSNQSLKLGAEGLTKEQEALHKLGLIDITKDNQLVVYNPVYAEVFNESWVKQKIENWRPYAAKFETWKSSSESTSDLLSKEELQKARKWVRGACANGQILSIEERNFLTDSQDHNHERFV